MKDSAGHLRTFAAAVAAVALLAECGGGGGYGGGGGPMGATFTPVPGDLVITEVMASPAGTETSKEWFEVLNRSVYPLNLEGLVVTGNVGTFTVPAGISIPSGAYFVFASSNDTMANAGLTPVNVVYGSALTLANASTAITLTYTGTPLDSVSFATPPVGASLTLAVSKQDPTSNDNIANWCTSTIAYGDTTQKGSPGAADPSCP